jgi:hypothetical protein
MTQQASCILFILLQTTICRHVFHVSVSIESYTQMATSVNKVSNVGRDLYLPCKTQLSPITPDFSNPHEQHSSL